MPPPLGKNPTKTMPDIQVFGREDSQATRAALRFFRERRIVVHFSDLGKRPIAQGELRRFVERVGAQALVDTESRSYREGGIAWLAADEAGLVARLLADASPLRLPLARYGNEVTVGPAEATWAAWLRSAARPGRRASR
jgi:arsenate reductase-like glutaredoxin family protein